MNKAGDVWHKAKEKDDFAMFCPLLQELVEYNRKFAAYYDSTRAPYDALLNEYERGVDTKMLDEFFATLRQTIVPLLQKIARKPQIDDSFLHNYYPVDKQKAFADYLMQVMGLDRGHCGLGETEHPFTLEFNNKDVRITTNYDTRNVASSMYSVLHEAAMPCYELGIRDDLRIPAWQAASPWRAREPDPASMKIWWAAPGASSRPSTPRCNNSSRSSWRRERRAVLPGGQQGPA